MILKLFSFCAVVQLVVSQAPITFQDGKIGVNFGGYHAEAGLGGLLTGNAAHGGLSASAGTPFGQMAHAGLGGNTGGNSRGGLFAGATAGSGVGASASLAGDLNNGGSFGVGQAEAHVPGVQREVIKTVSTNVATNVGATEGTGVNVEVAPVVPVVVEATTIPPQPVPVTESGQSVIQIQTQSNIPTSTSGQEYIPPQSEQSEKSEQSEQSDESELSDQSEIPDQSAQSELSEQTTQSIIQSTTTLAPKTTAASPSYAPAGVPAQGPSSVASSSSVAGTNVQGDDDDNDLTDNRVPQIQNVPQTITQVVSPAAVHVQKIKVRPVPQYTVYQKQVQVPAYVTKTYSYQPPIVEAAPVKSVVQYPIPAYQPVLFHKRIQITAPYPQVVQPVEQVETSAAPSTTSTTPRPPYVYTYDKQKVINEIFSIPFHALRAVNEIINAKLAGGYSVQKTVSYA